MTDDTSKRFGLAMWWDPGSEAEVSHEERARLVERYGDGAPEVVAAITRARLLQAYIATTEKLLLDDPPHLRGLDRDERMHELVLMCGATTKSPATKRAQRDRVEAREQAARRHVFSAIAQVLYGSSVPARESDEGRKQYEERISKLRASRADGAIAARDTAEIVAMLVGSSLPTVARRIEEHGQLLIATMRSLAAPSPGGRGRARWLEAEQFFAAIGLSADKESLRQDWRHARGAETR